TLRDRFAPRICPHHDEPPLRDLQSQPSTPVQDQRKDFPYGTVRCRELVGQDLPTARRQRYRGRRPAVRSASWILRHGRLRLLRLHSTFIRQPLEPGSDLLLQFSSAVTNEPQ